MQRCLDMKAQNLRQTVSRAAMPPASIRFSGADGKVLTWMTSSASVHTDLRLLRDVRRQPQGTMARTKIPPGLTATAGRGTVVSTILIALRALSRG